MRRARRRHCAVRSRHLVTSVSVAVRVGLVRVDVTVAPAVQQVDVCVDLKWFNRLELVVTWARFVPRCGDYLRVEDVSAIYLFNYMCAGIVTYCYN